MKYHFMVTGIGFCIGNITNHEELVEFIITEKKPARQKSQPTIQYAINTALKYKDEKPVLLLSSIKVSENVLAESKISEQQSSTSFRQMLEDAGKVFAEKRYENVLLLGQGEEGYAAVLLSRQPERSFAQVEIDTGKASDEVTEEQLMNAMMQFINAVVEIRYAFKLDGSVKDGDYIWHWMEKRELKRTINGILIQMKEAELVNKEVFESKRYIFPVVFDTIDEAREALGRLQQYAAQHGLYKAMLTYIDNLKNKKHTENKIVLLVEDYDSLKAQIDELLAKSGQLMTEGFRWKSATGSCYIRKSTKTPKVVFMNPPGGMFTNKPFRRYVSKLYGFVEGEFQPSKSVFSGKYQNKIMAQYLKEISTTYAVMYLLAEIGICPDYLSGASMGELVFDFLNMEFHSEDKSGQKQTNRANERAIEEILHNILESQKVNEEAYFGYEVDLMKYYLKCNAEDAKQVIAKYDDVFVIIEGSPKDVFICGQKASCEKLIQELGCVAIELDDPNYIHTPVLEREFEKIRTQFVDMGTYLNVDGLPYQLFSTQLNKIMDSSSEMFAENVASIITRPVDYTKAVKALYEQDARIFIDLSTTHLCGNWAKETLSGYQDVEVISIYEEKDTADYLIDLCALMLAENVNFDFEKLYSRLTFRQDKPVEEIPKGLLQQYIANQLVLNQKAYEVYLDAENKLFSQIMEAYAGNKTAASVAVETASKKDYLWDREQVIEMTDRSMAAVLGDQYKEVDQYPIRARMPLPPFLFVSRIISIDAEFGKLRPSSIVAEYDLDETCVFRTGDTQISPLIGSEASHIAIFLIAYMGLDAMSKGNLSYRAIDSSQVSYCERPFKVGDIMRTVLRINRFVQNGSTILLFFTFETYNGDELIAVTEATGGFFTKEELASNKGIIAPKKILKKVEPKEFLHYSDCLRTSYEKEQVSAFYDGNYEACFGGSVLKPSLKEVYYIPYDMKMIDRVTRIDYNGGMYGRGIICGEKQITPDMWPFKAHFKNDPVFPAIIMTDGVTQLGVFLFAHAGLLAQFENTNVTMIQGNCVKSKFRGQARHGYSMLGYEVHVKDVIHAEDSIAVYFDAKIFNDGLQIIQVESFALKIFSDSN